jgi:methylenetetrahydrofolate dehydrogenase (NADP+) / methenyltetrahydrofolate cyclohydrolase
VPLAVDIGINRLPDGKIVGDVDFDEVSQKASYITPVPGGPGPMAVTMLPADTITAAQRMWGGNRRSPVTLSPMDCNKAI